MTPGPGELTLKAAWDSLKKEHPEAVGMKVLPLGDSWMIVVMDATDTLPDPRVGVLSIPMRGDE